MDIATGHCNIFCNCMVFTTWLQKLLHPNADCCNAMALSNCSNPCCIIAFTDTSPEWWLHHYCSSYVFSKLAQL
jgi:hypothetical protein